jgi:hypothetical protein
MNTQQPVSMKKTNQQSWCQLKITDPSTNKSHSKEYGCQGCVNFGCKGVGQ